MRRSTRTIVLAALATLGLAQVSALTGANTFLPSATAPHTGYTTTTVSRPAGSSTFLSSLRYSLNPSRASIASVTLVLNNVNILKPNPVRVKFNGGSEFPCNDGQASLLPTTTYTYTCTPAVAQPTSTLTSTGVTIP